MNKKKIALWLSMALLSTTVLGCGGNQSIENTVASSENSSGTGELSGESSGETVASDGDAQETDSTEAEETVELTTEEIFANCKAEIKNADAFSEVGSDAIEITCEGTQASFQGDGVTVSGETILISKEGTYVFKGNWNGMIQVDAGEDDKVRLVLDGITIHNENGPAILGNTADKVIISLMEGTENTLSDGSTERESGDAVVICDSDLSINGTGTLIVQGNDKHGIVGKDDLKLVEGTYQINAKNTALKGNDSVCIFGGSYELTTEKDSISAADEAGFVYIENGTFVIDSKQDAISAETAVRIVDGSFTIATEDVSDSTEDTSCKGIKGTNGVWIENGTFMLETADDAIHSNHTVLIDGGIYQIHSGDDGIHGDEKLWINDGNIVIAECYEGLEATDIVIEGGDISITASDDGINAAGGNDSSGFSGRDQGNPWGGRGNFGERPNGKTQDGNSDQSKNASNTEAPEDFTPPENGEMPEGFTPPENGEKPEGSTPPVNGEKPEGFTRPGNGTDGDSSDAENSTESASSKDNFQKPDGGFPGGMSGEGSGSLTINGGTIYVNAQGDGLDSNGSITQNGGSVVVDGPSDSMNGALDYDSVYTMNGGSLIAVGVSSMFQTISDDSTVYAITLGGTYSAGSHITVKDQDGTLLFDFTSAKKFESAAIASEQFKQGSEITVSVNDEIVDTVTLQETKTSVGTEIRGMGGF